MAYTLTARAPGASDLTAKNRVWGFFANPSRTRPANRRQPLQLRRKIRPTATKTVSGIPYWPSRDPIGERGGVNLYGFVRNDGVNLWDVLGLELPDNLKCCKIKKIIVNFNQVKEAPNHKVSEDGMYNHKTGRLFLGTITVSCADGNSKDWDTQTGGMRMKTSAVRGPGDRNPLGDDSAAPAGDFTVSTSPSGGTKGYLINTSGTNRDLIKIHYASYEGSHGCATSRDPEEWKIFAELMALNKATYRQNSVPIRIQYVGVSPPVGNRGNGKSDPPIVPVALPVPSGF